MDSQITSLYKHYENKRFSLNPQPSYLDSSQISSFRKSYSRPSDNQNYETKNTGTFYSEHFSKKISSKKGQPSNSRYIRLLESDKY